MRSCTAQQMADFFARQVMMGRGQWIVQLDPRDGGSNIVTPSRAVYDETTKTVYVAARTKGVHGNGNS